MQGFSARKAFVALVGVDLALVALSLVPFPSGTVRRWLDLGGEANVPTWFSSVQLLILAILAAVRASTLGSACDRHLRRLYVLMAAVFLLFSADETAMIHEGLTQISTKIGLDSPLPQAHGIWIFVYGITGAALLALSRRGALGFLREKSGTLVFVLGAVVFLLGGVLVETAGYYLRASAAPSHLLDVAQISTEEGLELLGQSVMIFALLIKLETDGVRLVSGRSPP